MFALRHKIIKKMVRIETYGSEDPEFHTEFNEGDATVYDSISDAEYVDELEVVELRV